MGEQKRILLLENDKDTLFLISSVLKKSGYLVESCEVGSGVVEFKHATPDLFVLDKDLPTIDGIAITKFLRLQPNTKMVPIIMISGHAIRKKASQAGTDEFIMKPFSITNLLEVIDRHLHKVHLEEPVHVEL